MGRFLPKWSQSDKTLQDSSFEILDYWILDSAEIRVHSTPYHETNIISSTSITLSPILRMENISSKKESTRLFEQLVTTME